MTERSGGSSSSYSHLATASFSLGWYSHLVTKPPACQIVDIEDNGPGISLVLRSKCSRHSRALRKTMSKEIVAVHGGEIAAHDSASGGTLMSNTALKNTLRP